MNELLNLKKKWVNAILSPNTNSGMLYTVYP